MKLSFGIRRYYMFICDACLKKHYKNIGLGRMSYGRCECCKKTITCCDIPSQMLIRKEDSEI